MLNANTFLPHGYCIKWTPDLLWLYVVSDLLIVLAYYSIPFTLAYFVWKRKDLQFRWIFLLFSAFILACGTTHLLGIVVLWNPIYWIDAGMKAVTAFISLITAIALVILLPKALKLPSPVQLDMEVRSKLDAFEKLRVAQSSLVDMNQLKKAEEATKQIASTLKATLETIPDMLFEMGADGRYYSVHSSKSELIPFPVNELVGKTIYEVLPEEVVTIISRALHEADVQGYSRGAQFELDVPLGRRWFELSVAKKSVHNGENKTFLVLSRDITERKMSELELKIAATAFEAQEGIIVTDAETNILRVNNAFVEITGYSAEETVGKTPSFLSSGKHDKKFYAAMWAAIKQKGAWEGEIWNRRKCGEIYPERLVITAVKDVNGNITNYVASLADITESKAASDEIKNLAFYDPLTQLPNRRLLLDRLEQALATSNHNGQIGALLFLDIDHFKILNDTLGHSTGDLLLKMIAARLKSCVREADTVARIGGDEFVILIEDLGTEKLVAASYTEALAEKILHLIAQPYKLDSYDYSGSVSIGATLFFDHEAGIEDLLKQADIAMYQAKASGRNAIRFFDIPMQEAVSSRVNLERELRYAIDNNQFELYYQIQVNKEKVPIGAEALIRWMHPDLGTISPAEFIPLAEDTGLILPIGQWVLDTACAQLKAWQSRKLTREFSISINVSAKQFNHENFLTQVHDTVIRHAIDPAFLNLELTESMLLESVEQMIDKMIELRKIGIRFELDDFGTGYSSLQYLKRLPLNQLKIDQSFIRDISIDSNDKTLVRTIIAMAHNLDLKVIAEGVEDEEQRQFLMDYHCDHFQGYLFGKPMPISDLENILKVG
jgi:diguanylate cyclase (GGDEF)-like protein/PAS domain S-box-containing protein